VSTKHCVIACDAGTSDSAGTYIVTIADHSRHGLTVNMVKVVAGTPRRLEHEDVRTTLWHGVSVPHHRQGL
jgi:predicted component of type VI protein secretion system